jgi:hypothetical protein
MAFFVGTVNDHGQLHLNRRGAFNLFLFGLKGKTVRIEIDAYDKHSHNQRKWFHWVCRYIAKHTDGHTEADVKLAAKGLHLPALFDETGEPRIGQTRRLTKEDYSMLIDATIQWAAEKLELVVPDPRKA